MELIGRALRKYAEVNKTLPPAYTTDKEGKPGLSCARAHSAVFGI